MATAADPRLSLIEEDDGRFVANRYRAVARREIDASGEPSGYMPIDPAHSAFAALRGTPPAVSAATAATTLRSLSPTKAIE
ncbi:hypothetical protein ACV229_04255 [Burkholderia sp. MR1-5-21]